MSVFTNLSVNYTEIGRNNVSDGQPVAGEWNMSRVILSAIIIIANSLTLLTIKLNSRLRTTLDMYLASVATAGLLTGFCVLLIAVINTSPGILDKSGSTYKYVCLSIVSLTAMSGMATMTSMTLLTVDRCVSVTFPFQYMAEHTQMKALLATLGSWAGSSIYGCLNFWFNRFSADVECSFMTVADMWYVRYLSSTLIITLIATNNVCCVKIARAYFLTKWSVTVVKEKKQRKSGIPKTSKKMARTKKMLNSEIPLCKILHTTTNKIKSKHRKFGYEIDEDILGQNKNLNRQKPKSCCLAEQVIQNTSSSLLKSRSFCWEGIQVSKMCQNFRHFYGLTQTITIQEGSTTLERSRLDFNTRWFSSLCNLTYQRSNECERLLLKSNPLSRWNVTSNLTTCYHTISIEKNMPKDKGEISTSASYCFPSIIIYLERTKSAVLRNPALKSFLSSGTVNKKFGSEQRLSVPSPKSSKADFNETKPKSHHVDLGSKVCHDERLKLSPSLGVHGDSIELISDERENEPSSVSEHVEHGGAFINISDSSKSSSPIAGPKGLRAEPMVNKKILARVQSKSRCQIVTMLFFFQTMYILFFLPCLVIFISFCLMVMPEWLTQLALLLLSVSNVVFTVIYMVFSARYRAVFSSIAKRLQVFCNLDQDTIDII